MPGSGGSEGQIGLAKETTYNVYTAPTQYLEFNNESIKYERERIESEGIRKRRTLHRWAQGVQRVTGDVECELPNVGPIGLLLGTALGGYTIATNSPITGANTHTFVPGVTKSKNLTIQVGRPSIAAGVVQPHSYKGCKVVDWEVSAAVNEYAKFTASVYGASESTTDTLGTATYPTALSPFTYVQGDFKIAAASYPLREVTISGAMNLESDMHRIQAQGHIPNESEESGLKEITFEATSDFIDLTQYNRYVNGAEASVSLKFTGGLIGATTQNYTLELVGNARFDGETPEISGRELLEMTVTGKFFHATSDSSAFSAILVNDDSHYGWT